MARHAHGECWQAVAGRWREQTGDDAPGYTLYDGPSLRTGDAIIVVITNAGENPSRNAKTGAEAQTWIMPRDCPPTEAVRGGADEAVCGDCVLRPRLSRQLRDETGERQPMCYVNTARGGPYWVWRNWEAGKYPAADPMTVGQILKNRGRPVRLGSWGDPTAVPKDIWDALLAVQEEHTGYTHQWRSHPEYAADLMASVNNSEQRAEAKELGFRTFRVLRVGEAPEPGEIMCPSTVSTGQFTKAGTRVTCEHCQLCSGASGRGKVDIAITDHGPTAPRASRSHQEGQERRRCADCGHGGFFHGSALRPGQRLVGEQRKRAWNRLGPVAHASPGRGTMLLFGRNSDRAARRAGVR